MCSSSVSNSAFLLLFQQFFLTVLRVSIYVLPFSLCLFHHQASKGIQEGAPLSSGSPLITPQYLYTLTSSSCLKMCFHSLLSFLVIHFSSFSLFSPLASLLTYTLYICVFETSQLNKQDNAKFVLDLEPPSSCYPIFLLYFMVKLLDSSLFPLLIFHLLFLNCRMAFFSLFTETASLQSPVTFVNSSKYLFALSEVFSLIFFSLIFFFFLYNLLRLFLRTLIISLPLKCRSFPRSFPSLSGLTSVSCILWTVWSTCTRF